MNGMAEGSGGGGLFGLQWKINCDVFVFNYSFYNKDAAIINLIQPVLRDYT